MNYKEKSNPIRFRSKMCLLKYSPHIDHEKLKKLFKSRFKIQAESDWKYIIKDEFYKDSTSSTFAFLSFTRNQDVFTDRLNFTTNDSRHSCRCWVVRDKDLVLYTLLKDINITKTSFVTNREMNEIELHTKLTLNSQVFVKQKQKVSPKQKPKTKQQSFT